jgi:SAM-dependent methyltransferase
MSEQSIPTPAPSADGLGDQYLLGYRAAEQRRLQRQAESLADEASWLFDRVGPLDGRRVVELGCGPRGYLDALSERVGPDGTVVGVERSFGAVELARSLVAHRGLVNVEVIHGDARAKPASSTCTPVRSPTSTSPAIPAARSCSTSSTTSGSACSQTG